MLVCISHVPVSDSVALPSLHALLMPVQCLNECYDWS